MSAVDTLLAELRGVFGDRLRTLLAFGPHAAAPDDAAGDPARTRTAPDHLIHTLAIVDVIGFADLAACAALSAGWTRRGLSTPLMLGADEVTRSLDAFPLEFAEIVATRRLIAGTDPFDAIALRTEDVRRACEVQAKGHLLHLREGYIDAAGRAAPIAHLVAASAAPFRSLLLNVARLEGAVPSELTAHARKLGLPDSVVERLGVSNRSGDIKKGEAVRLYADCLDAAERLARYVDQWAR